MYTTPTVQTQRSLRLAPRMAPPSRAAECPGSVPAGWPRRKTLRSAGKTDDLRRLASGAVPTPRRCHRRDLMPGPEVSGTHMMYPQTPPGLACAPTGTSSRECGGFNDVRVNCDASRRGEAKHIGRGVIKIRGRVCAIAGGWHPRTPEPQSAAPNYPYTHTIGHCGHSVAAGAPD